MAIRPKLNERDRETFCRRYAEKYFRLAMAFSYGNLSEAEWNRLNRENTKELIGIFRFVSTAEAKKEAALIRKVETMERNQKEAQKDA